MRWWIVANVLGLGLPLVGVPLVVAVIVAAPFALRAGWLLVPAVHVCGWCGRRFSGPYEWLCRDCEEGETP